VETPPNLVADFGFRTLARVADVSRPGLRPAGRASSVGPVNAAVGLIERVLPSTVHLQARIPESHPSARILGTERMGSGTIVDAAGLILTVNYVVLGAEQVRVTLLDQRAYVAEVVRHDYASGLALVRIPEDHLTALPLRRTTDLVPGEEAFIVASVGEGGARVASGAISYIGPFDANWEYVLDRAIMTTAMNPGLGGGPLLDTQGRVIGVVSLNLNEIGRFSLSIPADYYLDGRDALLGGRAPPNPRAGRGACPRPALKLFAVRSTMPLGDFLVAYLQKIGVTHLFGIPGDLVLRLFSRLGKPRGLKIVTLSHEPGVGFAADGYARATGRIGVLCVTYGAGGHNMVNPVAGSFSERVPVLVISGGPGEEERKLGTLIHHQAKEIESQLRIYRELTCAARENEPATGFT